MSTFSVAFNEATVEDVWKILLDNDQTAQGKNEFAKRTQTAIQNIHADLLMLSQVMPRRFSYKTTEDDALRKLIKFVNEELEQNDTLTCKDAILQVVEKYQTPFYPTKESVHARTEEIRRENNARALERR